MTDHDTTPGAPETEALAKSLALLPTCTQCGKRFADRACGIAHAMIANDPLQHRLFAPLLATRDAAQRAAGAETALREAAEDLREMDADDETAYWLDRRAKAHRGAQC